MRSNCKIRRYKGTVIIVTARSEGDSGHSWDILANFEKDIGTRTSPRMSDKDPQRVVSRDANAKRKISESEHYSCKMTYNFEETFPTKQSVAS